MNPGRSYMYILEYQTCCLELFCASRADKRLHIICDRTVTGMSFIVTPWFNQVRTRDPPFQAKWNTRFLHPFPDFIQDILLVSVLLTSRTSARCATNIPSQTAPDYPQDYPFIASAACLCLHRVYLRMRRQRAQLLHHHRVRRWS